MRREKTVPIVILVLMCVLVTSGKVWLHRYQYRAYNGALPAIIEVQGLVAAEREPGLISSFVLSWWTGLRVESCGVVLLEITDESAQRIRATGRESITVRQS
jgi:hypothetical protein